MSYIRRSSAISILGFCLSLVAIPSRAQEPDPVALIKSAAANYRTLKSYQARVTVSTIVGTETSERHFIETGGAPEFRVEDEDTSGRVRVDDGQTQWTLDRKSARYAKTASAGGIPSYIGDLSRLDQNLKSAELLREDIYTVDGKTKRYLIVLI